MPARPGHYCISDNVTQVQWSTLRYLKRTRLTRVPRTPGLGPIRIAESGIEGGKCDSVCHTNPVRDLVALWCLAASSASGFDNPRLRIQRVNFRMFSKEAAQPAANLMGGSQKNFF